MAGSPDINPAQLSVPSGVPLTPAGGIHNLEEFYIYVIKLTNGARGGDSWPEQLSFSKRQVASRGTDKMTTTTKSWTLSVDQQELLIKSCFEGNGRLVIV